MLTRRTLLSNTLAAGAILAAGAVDAKADAVITSGSVRLGINDFGHLNTDLVPTENSTRTGIAYSFSAAEIAASANPFGTPGFYDATSPGCFCEGWGVSVNNAVSGYANVSTDGGEVGLTFGSFVSTPVSATSVVSLTGLPTITITQAYSVAVAGALFEDLVTISNTGAAAVTDVKYVRVMDWDVPLSEFSEFVTIAGTGTTTLLELSHDDGFESANPLDLISDEILAGTTDVDFVDSGPTDHGAFFRFNFGTLGAGESKSFKVYYGAAGSEADMLAALGLTGIELYSLGQTNIGGDVCNTCPTFAFGFEGVGGTPIVRTPEPSAMILLGTGLLGLAGLARRKKMVR
jgi:type IV pilus assembly protein PilY1